MKKALFMKKALLLVAAACVGISVGAQTTRVTVPVEGKYYRVVSANAAFANSQPAAVKAIYHNFSNDALAWANFDGNSASYYWTFTPGTDEGTYKMQNVFSGYAPQNVSNTGSIKAVADVNTVTVSDLGDDMVDIAVNVTANHKHLHANGHNNGAGMSGNICTWTTSANKGSASSWYIEEVNESEVLAAVVASFQAVALPDFCKTDEYKAIAADHSSATIAQIVAAYRESKAAFAAAAPVAGRYYYIKPVAAADKYVTLPKQDSSFKVEAVEGDDFAKCVWLYTKQNKMFNVQSGMRFGQTYNAQSAYAAADAIAIGTDAYGFTMRSSNRYAHFSTTQDFVNRCMNAETDGTHSWTFVPAPLKQVIKAYINYGKANAGKLGAPTAAVIAAAEALIADESATDAQLEAMLSRIEYEREVPVAGNAYVRVVNMAGNPFVVSASASSFVVPANAANNDILFYNQSEHLISYASGRAPKLSGNQLTAVTDVDGEATAAAITFKGQRQNRLYLDFTGGNRHLYGDGTNIGAGDFAPVANQNKDFGYTFEVVPVESLPVTLSENGYATFVAGVNTVVPDDVKAYRIVLNHATGVADYYEVSASVPANTPVLLKGTTGATVNVAIDLSEVATLSDESAAANHMGHALHARSVAEGENVYALSGNTFTKVNEGEAVNGAFVVTDAADAANSYQLSDTPTLGISEINADKADNGAIFDLQGRRLAAPVKGINIIGGRKVLVR